MTDSTDGDESPDDPACTACGDAISETDLRRVVTKIENGQVVTVLFCGDGCLDDWRSAGEFDSWNFTAKVGS